MLVFTHFNWLVFALWCALGGVAAGGDALLQFGEAIDREQARFRHGLERLASDSADQETAARLRGWALPELPLGDVLVVPGDLYYATAGGTAWPGLSRDGRFMALRKEHAAALFDLAQRAAEIGALSWALELAARTVREDPDHARARYVLGYERHASGWVTAFQKKMLDSGRLWDSRFGWIKADDLPHYEAGKRRAGRGWVSADVDAQRHASIGAGWRVRTDHFLVTTNRSQQAAAELAARLEQLFQVWRQLFAGYYMGDREVQARLAGERSARGRSKPYRVIYHRDRQQFVDELRRRQPKVAGTLGIYFDVPREAHFFAGPEQVAGTLYHEAVHQLFEESRPVARQVGGVANFWIVEGIATYFESLVLHEDDRRGRYFTIGEASGGRLPAARERLLIDGYYVPLAELVRLGKPDLQRHPDIARLYSQSAGLATFLMQADQGRYRESLVRYLAEVYAGQDDTESLAAATGLSLGELDARYRQFLESLP